MTIIIFIAIIAALMMGFYIGSLLIDSLLTVKTEIQVIPNDKQRYNTIGDWKIFNKLNKLIIKVSDTGNEKYNNLIAFHEHVEAMLCINNGIDEKDITKFDIEYEKERELGLHKEDDEPGDDRRAPYYWEHQTATLFEKTLALDLGVEWKEYNQACIELSKTYREK